MCLLAVSVVLFDDYDIYSGHQGRAAKSASAAAYRCHDNSDAQEQLQYASACYPLPHIRRAFFITLCSNLKVDDNCTGVPTIIMPRP